MMQSTWQWTPYTPPLLAAAATSIWLALRLARRRPHQGASRTGVLLLAASVVWTLGYALELSSTELTVKILWAKAQYAGIVGFPVFWLTYALRYTGRGRWLTFRRRLLLAIVPVCTLVLASTTEVHGLMWKSAELRPAGPYIMLVQDFGPAFWVFLTYTTALIVAGFAVLIRTFGESPKLHGGQIRVLFLGAFILGASILLDVLDLVPTEGLDLEPFAVALLIPVMAWGLFRLHFGDIVPVAHESIFRGLHDSVLVLDEQDRILALNPAARDLIGAVTDGAVGMPVAAVWPEWKSCTKGATQEGEEHWEWTRQNGDRSRTYEVRVTAIRDAKGATVSRIFTLHDITAHKETEREVRDRRRYLEGVLEATPDAIVALDAQGRVVEWNSAAVALFGCSSAEAIGQGIDALISGVSAQEGIRALIRQAFGGAGLPPAKTICQRHDGTPVDVLVAAAPIRSNGELIGAVIVYTDISEQKRLENELRGLNEELERRVAERTSRLSQMNDELVHAIEEHEQARSELLRIEERITASLREKEVMLKEIHHRVKNNLQVISSLLHLQSRSIEDPAILEIFEESQHRVRSMALIHEKLYRSDDLARVDFGSYIEDLSNFLFRSYRSQRGAVRLSVDAEGISLPIDTAVPCGLIINELVSNALKHAFRDGREGEIRVTLGINSAQQMLLTVSDDGLGFPPDVDYRGSPSLGLQLVNTLVDQLDGEIELHNGKGSRFEIQFAAPSVSARSERG